MKPKHVLRVYEAVSELKQNVEQARANSKVSSDTMS